MAEKARIMNKNNLDLKNYKEYYIDFLNYSANTFCGFENIFVEFKNKIEKEKGWRNQVKY